LLGAGAVFLAIQLVRYGWWHENPPVTQDAPWPSAQARELAVRACYDCHSNEIRWPPHSYVAPMSWLVRADVESGRDELNFSSWDTDDNDADDAAETLLDGEMPPTRYTLIHPDARLSDEMVAVLVDGLLAMEGEDGDNSGPG
jgi:Haem-binding domain